MHVLRISLKQFRSTFLKQGKGAECNKTPFYDIIYYVNHSTFFKVWRDRKENMETPTKCLLLLREKATVWCTVGGNDNNWWCSIAASYKELHPTSTAIYRILPTSSKKAIFKEKVWILDCSHYSHRPSGATGTTKHADTSNTHRTHFTTIFKKWIIKWRISR